MGHRRLALALAAAALLLLPAPAGAAALRFRDAGPGSAISGDGTSVIAWSTPEGAVRVVTPDGRMRDVVPPCGGRFKAAGGAALLFACGVGGIGPGGEEPFALQRLDGTPPFLFHGPPGGAGGERWDPYAMGRAWIEGFYAGNRVSVRLYRRRDDSRTFRDDSDAFGPDHVLDIDRSRLARRMCPGVRRMPVRGDGISVASEWWPAEYDPPWAVITGPTREMLWRCTRAGARKVRTGRVWSFQLGGGIVTWGDISRPGRPMLAVLRPARRTKRYRLPRSYVPIARAGRMIVLGSDNPYRPLPLLLTRIPAR